MIYEVNVLSDVISFCKEKITGYSGKVLAACDRLVGASNLPGFIAPIFEISLCSQSNTSAYPSPICKQCKLKMLAKLFQVKIIPILSKQHFLRILPRHLTSQCPKKKFYRNVSITEIDRKYEINLDNRKLKTPSGKVLQLPNKALATVVATEWDAQHEKLNIQNMHLTMLCNTALDNPNQQSHEDLVESILQYLENDTLCYRYCDPPELLSWQKQHWDPILSWFKDWYKVKIDVCEDLSGVILPKETTKIFRKNLMSYKLSSLMGVYFATETLKSLILTFATINRVLDVDKAVELSRLEVIYQISKWGKVEWSHDLELLQTTSRVAAAVIFINLNEEESYTSKNEKL